MIQYQQTENKSTWMECTISQQPNLQRKCRNSFEFCPLATQGWQKYLSGVVKMAPNLVLLPKRKHRKHVNFVVLQDSYLLMTMHCKAWSLILISNCCTLWVDFLHAATFLLYNYVRYLRTCAPLKRSCQFNALFQPTICIVMRCEAIFYIMNLKIPITCV